jgi:hypothetical protein
MSDNFERHRQPWKAEEAGKLKTLAAKGMGLKAIAKALGRSEESTKDRAKADGIAIAKKR